MRALRKFTSGLVVSANPVASMSGLSVLKNGGNAVDAAVTTAHTLGVASPAFSGIGGAGFALIWLAREEKAVFVDFREKAPSKATEEMFKLTSSGRVVREENAVGYKSVAVPGTIAGHALMLEKYGTVRLRDTLEPAIKCARRGFRVGRALGFAWKLSVNKLKRFDESRKMYLNRSRPYHQGEKVALPSLAKDLETIGRGGVGEFYNGTIAKKICDDMTSNGGLVTSTDLERYKPTLRETLRGSYEDYEIITAPPPSSGGAIILQSLNMLENHTLKRFGHNSTQSLHIIAEALARSNLSCRARISDPDFTEPPIGTLISKEFAKELGSTINPNRASIPTQRTGYPLMPASNTSHLVAIDSEHNVVSMTESVECYFGSGITVPGTGIILNDTMHDFEPRPGMANSVAPLKIPMSSMSPTIILKNGLPTMAVGSAGGPRIVSSILQVLLNVLEFGIGLQDAVAAPRIHVHGNLVQLENTITGKTATELRKMGHSVEVKKLMGSGDPGLYFGGVHAAQLSQENGLSGAADPRRDGLAIGIP